MHDSPNGQVDSASKGTKQKVQQILSEEVCLCCDLINLLDADPVAKLER